MTTRIQPWTEPELMDREAIFEGMVEKALHKTMRQAASTTAGVVLTAAATLPVDPAVEGSYSALQTYVMAEWTAQVSETLYPYLTDTFTESASRVVDGVQAASGVVVDQLTGTYADEVLQYAYNRMVGIGESLWLAIRDQLVEGYNAGEGIPEIAERLTQVAGLSTPRALTVARTEIISAANNGSYLQMLDAGFNEAVTKVWLATEDTRTRLSHRHADNQGVDLTGEFNVDIYSGDIKTGTEPMEFPGDPTATPGNIINCRCSLAFDFEEEAEEVLVAAAAFTEKDHPRDKDGKFKKKGAADKYIKVPDKNNPPAANSPDAVKVAWIATHKWDSMGQGQKAVLIKSITEPTWEKLSPELKAKIKDAPNQTSHPQAKELLEKALEKFDGFNDTPKNAKQAIEEAVAKAADKDSDAPAAGGRPLGGVDTKTGKALVPGKPTKLRVQLLYNTTFADGAIMAVRKDSGERIVWDEKTKKIKRQKLSADGKYETTEALSRGAAYAAWKDEDGWTVPDAGDLAAPAATPTATATPTPAVGKPVKLKVQLIYQTPFDDGDIVAVNPTTGETIHWDAKKKRMVVTSELGTTEYTRGALYKEFKDEDGWHLPLDKKGAPIVPAPVPAKKAAVPPAKSVEQAAPEIDPATGKYKKAVKQSATFNGKTATVTSKTPWTHMAVVASPDNPGGGLWSWHKSEEAASKPTLTGTQKKNGWHWVATVPVTVEEGEKETAPAAPSAVDDSNTDPIQPKKVMLKGDATGEELFEKYNSMKDGLFLQDGSLLAGKGANGTVVVHDGATSATIKAQDVNAKNLFNAVKAVQAGTTVPAGSPIPEPYTASDDSNAIFQAWDNGIPGEIWKNGPFSVGLAKNGNLLFLDSKHGGGVGVVKSADVNSENIDKALEAVMAGKSWTMSDAIPEVDPNEISAPGGSEGVSAGGGVISEDDISNLINDWEDFQIDDTVFDGVGYTLTKSSYDSVEVTDKSSGKSFAKEIVDLTPEHINDFLELNAPSPATTGPQAPSTATNVVTEGSAANIKDFAKDPNIVVTTELFNGKNFKIFKGSPGAIIIYPKQADGYADTNKGHVLFGDEISSQGIQDVLVQLDLTPAAPAEVVDSKAKGISDAYFNAPGGTYTLLAEEPNLKIYRATSGRMVIKDGTGDTVGILNSKDVNPENVAKAIAAVQAGYDFAPGDEIPDVSVLSPAPNAPAPVAVNAPAVDTSPVGNLPNPASLKNTGQTLGTHGGQLYKDEAGDTWLFKPSTPSQKHLALAEVAAGKLHEMAGLTTPEMGEITIGGKFGMIQKIIPNTTSPYAGSFNAKTVTKEQVLQLQKEHVFDWLVSNHDSNGSNVLKDADGKLIGIDKGQAFKFFGADTLDPTFNPNGHAVPVTNQLFQQYIKAPLSVDISPKSTLNNFIQKIQAIPDAEFKAILRPYAEAAAKNNTLAKGGPSYLGLTTVPFPANDVEAFLDAAVARKNALDHTITEFYKKLDDAADGQSVDWKISAPPAPSVINPPTVVPIKVSQKPIQLSAGVLTGKKSQSYFDGQVIAEHPSSLERLVWNAKSKKYDIQLQTSSGKWETAYSYNKSAALANLKNDSGWVTPSTLQVANSGTSAGDPTLAPNIAGAPQVHTLAPKTAVAPKATAVPKPKISIADLKAQADLSTVNLSSTAKAAIWTNFRTKGVGGSSTVTLSSDPKDIFQGLLIAQAMHNKANPSAPLSLLQVLRLADVVGTEKSLSSVNQYLYEKKIIDWLGTPDGLKAAQNVSDTTNVAGIGTSSIDSYNKVLEKFKEHHAKSLLPTAGWSAAMQALPSYKIKSHTPGQAYPELSVSQGNQFGKDMIAKYGAIPSDSKASLRSYTGSSYGAFNAYFRSFGKESSHMAADARKAAKGLRPSPRALTVHRNSSTVFDETWQPSLAQLQDFKGVVFTEDALTSTSNDGHTFNVKKYRFIIEVPEGTPIAWVDEFSLNKGESEFILGPGLKYEILEITGPGTGSGASTANKTAVIRMRVVP